MKKQIISFSLGALTPLLMSVIALLLIPVYYKMSRYNLLIPYLGIVGSLAIIFAITCLAKPNFLVNILEKLTPMILRDPAVEKAYARGLIMSVLLLICWLANHAGGLASLFH